jgi:hypothetical protein
VGSFDKKAFIAAVKSAIEAKSPKTLKEADDYKESGKAGEVKGEVKGLVTAGKEGEASDVEAATAAPPDTSKAVAKPVTPLVAEQQGPAAQVSAAGAVPKPAPQEQLNLAAGKHQVNQEMADADVTEPQLAQSNEPDFQQALVERQTAAKHADTAPSEYRAHEQGVLSEGKAQAETDTATAVTGMQGAKATALAALVADKGRTKSRDEGKRGEVTARIQAIFGTTETDVRKILDGIDPKVDATFEQGEAAARSVFENYTSAKMSAYKKDRYGGWLGKLRWLKDKIKGMPPKVNEFYQAGRELYLKQMDGVISRVADIVGADLALAKRRIAAGKAEIASYVKSLPKDLQRIGSQASQEIGDKFDALESDVDAKQDAIVDGLATKYVEARKGLDERIEALQAENRGLVDKAIGAIKAVVGTIRQLAAMLRDVFARAAGVVGQIIKHPVAFLENLVAGVKGGILRFKDNIVSHLRKGVLGWLFGTLAQAGVEMPTSFDVKGVLKLLASIFGLTWTMIRTRLVRQIGEKAMAAAEKGVDVFRMLAGEGVAGIWHLLVDKLGNIKETIEEQAKDFVITRIITSGITWLISLLNPAAAFIKACRLIYDIVMFFVNNADRLRRFVNTVLDSVADIVRGSVGAVVSKIEDVLGQMVPILIGFLASVIGLGGVGEKIRSIVDKLQKPVTSALDAVIKTGLKLAAPLIRGLKGITTKVKTKVAAGKAWARGKVAGLTGLGARLNGTSRGSRGGVRGRELAELPPVSRTAVMHGHAHTIRYSVSGLTIASTEAGLVVRALARLNAITEQTPEAEAQRQALRRIVELARLSSDVYRKKGASSPRFAELCDQLVVAVSQYGTRYRADDLDVRSSPVATSEQKSARRNWDADAEALGFRRTNEFSHDQPVYFNGRVYITPDVGSGGLTGSHRGGVWKMADSVRNLGRKETRMGTYDAQLERIAD